MWATLWLRYLGVSLHCYGKWALDTWASELQNRALVAVARRLSCPVTCMQISQEAGKVVWYSHLFKNFPQFVVIHAVKGFSIASDAEVHVFLELSCFFDDPMDVGSLISGSSAFSKSSLNIWKFSVHVLLKPNLENFEHYFTIM